MSDKSFFESFPGLVAFLILLGIIVLAFYGSHVRRDAAQHFPHLSLIAHALGS